MGKSILRTKSKYANKRLLNMELKLFVYEYSTDDVELDTGILIAKNQDEAFLKANLELAGMYGVEVGELEDMNAGIDNVYEQKFEGYDVIIVEK